MSNSVLEQSAAIEIASFLREVASSLDPDDPSYSVIEQHVVLLDALELQTSPLAFAKSIKELRHKVTFEPSHTRTLPYRVACLVQVLCLADVLRSSADLRDAVHMAFQNCAAACFEAALQRNAG